MDALTAQRAGNIRSMSIELGRYADEHELAGDSARSEAALAASVATKAYADALEAPDALVE